MWPGELRAGNSVWSLLEFAVPALFLTPIKLECLLLKSKHKLIHLHSFRDPQRQCKYVAQLIISLPSANIPFPTFSIESFGCMSSLCWVHIIHMICRETTSTGIAAFIMREEILWHGELACQRFYRNSIWETQLYVSSNMFPPVINKLFEILFAELPTVVSSTGFPLVGTFDAQTSSHRRMLSK